MVLVEGENADGITVNQDNFDLTTYGDAPTITAPDRVISAILGTRDDAAEGGYQVRSTGVTWADPAQAATLRAGLAARKIENVMLVPAFLAAAALAQAAGNATNYPRTALLFVEPDTATLAVVNTADGSVADVRRRPLPEDDESVAELVKMVKGAEEMEAHPDGVFVVGSGVDIALIKPALEAATSLPVSAPEELEMALARGAALASANSPVFASSTAALAQAVGNAANYAHTALLYVEPDTATLAVVNTADGSVADVRRRFLPEDDDEAVAELVEMVKGAADMEAHPEGLVVVGSGVDITLIKPALEAATSLPVSAPEEPKVALARGAAPASANAQLLYGPAILEARNLGKSFGRWPTETPVLKNINLRISPGEFVALIGPSGSGKSTLLSILGLLEPPTSGDVLINQKSVARLSRQQLAHLRGRAIGYVFQSFNLLAGLSVAENVMLPGLLAGESGRAQYQRAIALLDQFGLAALAKRVPAELSGGEQQRVAIARALFMRPAVILADEPTGNLDTTNGRKVIDALYNLNSAGQTIVLVTHDRSIADEAPRLVSMLDGRVETDSGPIQVGSA
jgi:ABC-type lipoprotein export system ATPase subunit